MFLVANTSLFHLSAFKSKRRQLKWIIDSSHDARVGDFIALWLCGRLFFLQELCLSWLQMVVRSEKKTEVKQSGGGGWTSPALSTQTKQVLWGSAYGRRLLIRETCWSGLQQNVCFYCWIPQFTGCEATSPHPRAGKTCRDDGNVFNSVLLFFFFYFPLLLISLGLTFREALHVSLFRFFFFLQTHQTPWPPLAHSGNT